MKLCTTFGYEFTYLSNEPWSNKQNYNQNARYFVDAFRNKRYNSKYRVDCYNDSGCLEINSPAFTSTMKLEKFYDWMDRTARSCGGVPQHPKVAGGGCHIHTAIPRKLWRGSVRKLFLFMLNTFRIVQNNHYMAWIFNEYSDVISAQPFPQYISNYHDMKELLVANRQFDDIYHSWKDGSWGWDRDYVHGKFAVSKGSMMTTSNANNNASTETIEWRFFDMPPDFEGILDHTELVDRILREAMRMAEDDKMEPACIWGKEYANRLIENDKWVPLWEKLLDRLGLDWNRYFKYIERNYYLRRQGGWFWDKRRR